MRVRILLMAMAFICGYVVPFTCLYATSLLADDKLTKQITIAVGSVVCMFCGFSAAFWQDENRKY